MNPHGRAPFSIEPQRIGCGKTFLAAELCKSALEEGHRVLALIDGLPAVDPALSGAPGLLMATSLLDPVVLDGAEFDYAVFDVSRPLLPDLWKAVQSVVRGPIVWLGPIPVAQIAPAAPATVEVDIDGVHVDPALGWPPAPEGIDGPRLHVSFGGYPADNVGRLELTQAPGGGVYGYVELVRLGEDPLLGRVLRGAYQDVSEVPNLDIAVVGSNDRGERAGMAVLGARLSKTGADDDGDTVLFAFHAPAVIPWGPLDQAA